MLTGVYNGISGKIQIYVDGELDSEANISTGVVTYNSINTIWLGGNAGTLIANISENGMIGQFSDLRIYCTAFAANAIQSLYNVEMKADNHHNIHMFEIEEKTNTSSLKKTGVL